MGQYLIGFGATKIKYTASGNRPGEPQSCEATTIGYALLVKVKSLRDFLRDLIIQLQLK